MELQQQTTGSNWLLKIIAGGIIAIGSYFMVVDTDTTTDKREGCRHSNTTLERVTPFTGTNGKTQWKQFETCDNCHTVLESKVDYKEVAKLLAKLNKRY